MTKGFSSIWHQVLKVTVVGEAIKGLSRQSLNPLSANFTKPSNTLEQFVGKLPTNCLRVFHHFVGVALKGLTLKTIALSSSSKNENSLFEMDEV